MSSAMANRNYFNNLPSINADRVRRGLRPIFASSHEIIDLNGDVVICLPENEMAYHVGSTTYTPEALRRLSSYPNNCTYGIECTHRDLTGAPAWATLESIINRCAHLCTKYNLDPLKDIWLHRDVVGWKDCHRWFVNNPSRFQELKREVAVRMSNNDNRLEYWQLEAATAAIMSLSRKGIINDPNGWINRLAENRMTQKDLNWLLFSLLDRVTNIGVDITFNKAGG